MTIEIEQNRSKLPVLALRGLVLFPGTALSFDVVRKRSLAALKAAMDRDRMVFAVTQRNIFTEDSKPEDLPAINAWHAEIPLFSLLKEAQLPYIPVILLAYMRMTWLLRMYARFCKGLYHLLTSRRRVK